jgi:hypothetical protein
MGRHVTFAWCPEDWRRFELSVRAAYPNVFFYEELKSSEESGEAEPALMHIERLDHSQPGRTIKMLFPDPAWQPKLVRRPDKWGKLHWTFDQYWSPRIWMGSPTAGPGMAEPRHPKFVPAAISAGSEVRGQDIELGPQDRTPHSPNSMGLACRLSSGNWYRQPKYAY